MRLYIYINGPSFWDTGGLMTTAGRIGFNTTGYYTKWLAGQQHLILLLPPPGQNELAFALHILFESGKDSLKIKERLLLVIFQCI